MVGYGKSVIYNIIDTGISETAINGYIEQYIDHKHKKAYESCLDENQEVLTNEIGEPLIFNWYEWSNWKFNDKTIKER